MRLLLFLQTKKAIMPLHVILGCIAVRATPCMISEVVIAADSAR